ncbi:MAG: hypothetical protein RL199_421 [Pseudomonadota bacterium]|jgi:hypothetical protein
MSEPKKLHRTISIRVAYGWSGPMSKDRRWLGIRNFLKGVVKEAEARFRRRSGGQEPPPVEVRRLRAIAGDQIGRSIFKRIAETDVFVADISHRTRKRQRERTSNVLLELGAAMANDQSKVFILEDVKKGDPLDGIADLAGVLVSVLKADEETEAAERTRLLNSDIGLRQRLVSVVAKLMTERAAGPRLVA